MFLIFLHCDNLTKHFLVRHKRQLKILPAVADVNLFIGENESVGIVGESGCGKSTLLKLVLGLEIPTRGNVYYRGEKISHLTKSKLLSYRREIQAVFQDAASSLNPRLSAFSSVVEPLLNQKKGYTRRELTDIVTEIFEMVSLDRQKISSYPHEFSGGQQRRIALARALVTRPRLIVCDEATSGLDISVQAQLLNLLVDLREEQGVQYLFVSHDLSVIRYLCSRIIVMYGGHILEMLPVEMLKQAYHPYTQALVLSEPDLNNPARAVILDGEHPDLIDLERGCAFLPRCPSPLSDCANEIPPLINKGQRHEVACWKYV